MIRAIAFHRNPELPDTSNVGARLSLRGLQELSPSGRERPRTTIVMLAEVSWSLAKEVRKPNTGDVPLNLHC